MHNDDSTLCVIEPGDSYKFKVKHEDDINKLVLNEQEVTKVESGPQQENCETEQMLEQCLNVIENYIKNIVEIIKKIPSNSGKKKAVKKCYKKLKSVCDKLLKKRINKL